MRRAKESEKMATLDDKERLLSNDNLVITASDQPVAVAGIMGGASSEISDTTTTLILEAANFNNFAIRKSSMSLGLRSEASLRFEKGLDPNLTAKALSLAVTLLMSEADANVTEVAEYYPLPTEPITIITTVDFINNCLGAKLTVQEILRILTTLGFGVGSNKDALQITVPTSRQDVVIAEDLIEEIARIYGYENIKPTLPQKDLRPVSLTSSQSEDRLLRDNLRLLGYDEVYSYSFIGSDLYNKAGRSVVECLEIVNPLSDDLKFIRNDLIPGLLSKVALNSHNYNSFKIFEIGKEIHPKHEELKNELDAPTTETLVAVGAVYNVDNNHLEETYRKIKGEIEYLKAEKDAEINVINEKVLKNFGIKGPVITWKIKLDPYFKKHASLRPEIKDAAVTTPITEDISFYVDEKTAVGEIIKTIKGLSKLVSDVEVFDVYHESDKKSVALTVSYSDKDKQLSTLEVTPIRENIIKMLEEKFKLEVRKTI
ncbi:MAG: phenylalanine--tRNA ligase subunit beta [candidate division WWE3 bacterium]|nr:phenylalanine--tRNA ligase subunit beta [candidate division WWE3 bacterium]